MRRATLNRRTLQLPRVNAADLGPLKHAMRADARSRAHRLGPFLEHNDGSTDPFWLARCIDCLNAAVVISPTRYGTERTGGGNAAFRAVCTVDPARVHGDDATNTLSHGGPMTTKTKTTTKRDGTKTATVLDALRTLGDKGGTPADVFPLLQRCGAFEQYGVDDRSRKYAVRSILWGSAQRGLCRQDKDGRYHALEGAKLGAAKRAAKAERETKAPAVEKPAATEKPKRTRTAKAKAKADDLAFSKAKQAGKGKAKAKADATAAA